MKYLNPIYIKRISIWGRLVGLASMMYGAIITIFSFVDSLLYSIPGLLSIFMGKLLFDIGQEAKNALKSEEETVAVAEKMIKKYGLYLMVIGGVMVLSIIVLAVFFLMIRD